MKKILVPCDFSPNAIEALKIAREFAQLTESEIIVIYGLYLPELFTSNLPEDDPSGYYAEFVNSLERDAENRFRKLKMEEGIPSTVISFKVIHGDVVNSILTEAQLQDVDLIFMGRSGQSLIQKVFVGSTTEKVVEHSSVPVCIVHHSTALNNIRNILFPTDLTLDQDELIAKVKEVQKLFDATLHLLLVNTASQFTSEKMAKKKFQNFITQYHPENFETHFINDCSEEAGIINFANANHMDLVIMGTRPRKGLSHLLVRSITKGVVRKIECPILTFCLRPATPVAG